MGLFLLPILAASFYASKTLVQAYHESKTQLHMYSSNITNAKCLSCHDAQWVQSSPAMGMGEPIVSAHKRHAFSVFLRFSPSPEHEVNGQTGTDENTKGCVLCHQVTALGYESDPSYTTSGFDIQSPSDTVGGHSTVAVANKKVNPAVCAHCHGKWPRYQGSEHCGPVIGCDPQRDWARLDPRGCVARCHGVDGLGGWVAEAHDQLTAAHFLNWIDTRYANDGNYCLLCHGGYAWYQVFEWNPGDLHCLGCHKQCEDPQNLACGRRTNSPFNPNDPLPPDIRSLVLSNSKHPIGTQMRCTSCHGVRRNHRDGVVQHFGTSDSTNSSQLSWEINTDRKCGDCHSGTPGLRDEAAYAKYGSMTDWWETTRHQTFFTDGIATSANQYTNDPKFKCLRCHNPHGSDKGRLTGRPVWRVASGPGDPGAYTSNVWPGQGPPVGKKIELTTQSYVKTEEVATLVLHAPSQAGCISPGNPTGCTPKDPQDVWCYYETYTFGGSPGTYPTVACTPSGQINLIEDPSSTPRTWGKSICLTCHYKEWKGLVKPPDILGGEAYYSYYYRWAGSEAFNGVVGGVPGNTNRNAHLNIPAINGWVKRPAEGWVQDPTKPWVQAACLNCHNPHGTGQAAGEAQPGQFRYKYLVRQFDIPRTTSFQRRQVSLCMPSPGDNGQPASGCHSPNNVMGHLKNTSALNPTPQFAPPASLPDVALSTFWGRAADGFGSGLANYTDQVAGCIDPLKRVCYEATPFGTVNPESYMTNFRNTNVATPWILGSSTPWKHNFHWEHMGLTGSLDLSSGPGKIWNCCGDSRPLVGGTYGQAANTVLGAEDGLPTCVTCHIPHGSSSADLKLFRALTKEPLSVAYNYSVISGGSFTYVSPQASTWAAANSDRFTLGGLPYACTAACHGGGFSTFRAWSRSYSTVNLSP